MTTQAKILFGTALLFMVALGGLLTRIQGFQRVGVPGVKVVERPVYREDGEIVGTNAVALPETVLDFTSKEIPVAKVVNDWLPKDTVYGQRVYEAPDGYWLQSTVVLMGTDRTSIHKPEYCLTGQGFQVASIERDTVEIAQPHRYELPVVKMTLSREATSPDGQRIKQSALFVYWFVADDQLTADHNERMIWMARDQVTRGLLQRWAYVSCFTICHPGQERAVYSRMRDWIAASVPQFQIATRPAGALAAVP
jgi:hypothetical protein